MAWVGWRSLLADLSFESDGGSTGEQHPSDADELVRRGLLPP